MMLILGVDPGLRATGYAFLQGLSGGIELIDQGLVRTDDDAPLADRLQRIHSTLRALLEQHRPAQVAVEDLYATQRYPRTAILMGHVRGVVCLAAAELAIEVTALPPAAVKQAIAGFGAASKGQMQAAVQRLLGRREPLDSHVSDAIAICLTALSRAGVPLRLLAQEVAR
jgi:crossover junction endodeoxyribonuclease RuvC